ncbi:MAG TPA: DUF4145 domain-containing protein [Pseudomonas sabulinigri]|uniref:DUF4145 domain-containing protein n=1 Tax=marine sediment metagenome TaxID=412755 RepID=A0A0F9YGY6_9ZZZZ|nr:DUF4145 domain-containing protein [Halopseudomonas sabulinigri]HEC52859.1 DUF4145 domain-containing protein [Halopseudomonas sabulinigri]
MAEITENYEEGKSIDSIVKEHCAQCGRSTRHMIVTSYDHRGSEDYDGGSFSIDWSSSHQVVQCQGCMSSSFRQVNWFSEDMHQIGPDEWDDGERVTLYPKRSNNTRAIKEFWEVPNNLRRIYRESIDCFNNDSFTLTAAGLRALIEGLCAELGVIDGPKTIAKKDLTQEVKRFSNLEGKISGLHEKGFLTEKSANLLHEHRFMGNAAVHELAHPSRDELALAIEIIEHTFDSIFEIPAKGDELKHRRVRRAKKT